ncbi:MAG TPA: Gfo/Idh/MocA family oxidoreductase [Bacteroidota bacterium]|nr:Gfo/Idh/MocA family oxidoreductase [Bacteroidota bacterium]
MSQYSRRKFLQQLGAGIILLPGVPRFVHAAVPRSDKKLGIALIGLGSYSTYELAPALLETRNCRLAGIVTGTPEKAAKWKERYKIPEKNIYNYQNFDAIADNDDIDAVYVVLPNSMHHEFTLRAAAAGKHVICEKPMAVSVTECTEMINACRKAGVRLLIGYRLHFDPYHQAAMKFRMSKEAGQLHTVDAAFAFRIGDPTQWRLKKSLAGGGPLMDLGIYCIQASRYSTGSEPLTATATIEEKTDPKKFAEVEETIRWQLEFPDSVTATSMCSYNKQANYLKLTSENGWLELQSAFSYGGISGRTNTGTLDFPHINQQALQLDGFSRCITDHLESDADGEEGRKDMKVIEAIYRSAATGMKESVK